MLRRNAIYHTFIPFCWCDIANQPLDQPLFQKEKKKIERLIDNATSTKWDKSVVNNITTLCSDVQWLLLLLVFLFYFFRSKIVKLMYAFASSYN